MLVVRFFISHFSISLLSIQLEKTQMAKNYNKYVFLDRRNRCRAWNPPGRAGLVARHKELWGRLDLRNRSLGVMAGHGVPSARTKDQAFLAQNCVRGGVDPRDKIDSWVYGVHGLRYL